MVTGRNLITWVKKRKFNKLIQDNLDSLLQLAYMRCGNKELAEDLVQDTCIKAYNSFLTKETIENPKAWLYRILINTHIDYTRKKQFQTAEIEGFDFPDYKSPSQNIESSGFFNDLKEVLKEIEQEQRIVVYLSDIKEYSYKDISLMLEIPIGTVMSRLHRARQTLKKKLLEKGYAKEYASGRIKS
jgi:RNA polymerase sigma-70 factor (ECF subfamily)